MLDSDQGSRRAPPGQDQVTATSAATSRLCLEYDGRSFELRPGAVLIGRSSACQIVLDDGLVSRRHAQVVIGDHGLLVEDLGSANGVFVNGRRVLGSDTLKVGDQLQVGKQQFVLRVVVGSAASLPPERFTAETLHGLRAAADLSASVAPHADDKQRDIDATHREEVLELLGGVADKVLAMGRGDEAERVLSIALSNILTEVKLGRAVPQRVVARAATYAAKLAEATGRGRWVDYTIELYFALHRPLPIEFVDQMYAVLRKVDAVNLATLRAYLFLLLENTTVYGPNERFAIQRLEGFEHLVALR